MRHLARLAAVGTGAFVFLFFWLVASLSAGSGPAAGRTAAQAAVDKQQALHSAELERKLNAARAEGLKAVMLYDAAGNDIEVARIKLLRSNSLDATERYARRINHLLAAQIECKRRAEVMAAKVKEYQDRLASE